MFAAGPVALIVAQAPAPAGHVDFARQRYRNGYAFYDAGQYEAALAEFQASLELYASPNATLMVAHTLRALGRLPEAVTYYERTLGLASDRAQADPRYVETRAEAQKQLAMLNGQIGRVRLDVADFPPDGSITVGDRDVPRGAWGLMVPVKPGRVRIVAGAPGRERAVREVDVQAGRSVTVPLRLVELPSAPAVEPAWRRPALWSSAAAGGVGLAGFALFGLLAQREYDALEQRCSPDPCAQPQDVTAGRRYQLLTNVSLGVGLLGAASAVALWATGPRSGTREPGVALSIGPGVVSIRGRF